MNKQFLRFIKNPSGFAKTVLLSVARDLINTIPPGNYSPSRARNKFTSYVNIAAREYNKTAKDPVILNAEQLKNLGYMVERKFIYDCLKGNYKSLVFLKYRNK